MYRIGEFAQKIGRLPGAVRCREREGRIRTRRGPTRPRYVIDRVLPGLRRYEKTLEQGLSGEVTE